MGPARWRLGEGALPTAGGIGATTMILLCFNTVFIHGSHSESESHLHSPPHSFAMDASAASASASTPDANGAGSKRSAAVSIERQRTTPRRRSIRIRRPRRRVPPLLPSTFASPTTPPLSSGPALPSIATTLTSSLRPTPFPPRRLRPKTRSRRG